MCSQHQVLKTLWIELNKVKNGGRGDDTDAPRSSPSPWQSSQSPAPASIECCGSHLPPSQDNCSWPVGVTPPGKLHTPSTGMDSPVMDWYGGPRALTEIGTISMTQVILRAPCKINWDHILLSSFPYPILLPSLPFPSPKTIPLRDQINPCLPLCF